MADISEQIKEIEELQAQALRLRKSLMRQMREAGWKLAEIGDAFHLSRQRVHQILSELEES